VVLNLTLSNDIVAAFIAFKIFRDALINRADNAATVGHVVFFGGFAHCVGFGDSYMFVILLFIILEKALSGLLVLFVTSAVRVVTLWTDKVL